MAYRIFVWKPPTPEIRRQVAELNHDGLRILAAEMLTELKHRGRRPQPRTKGGYRKASTRPDRSGVLAGRHRTVIGGDVRPGYRTDDQLLEHSRYPQGRPYAQWVERRWFPLSRFFNTRRMNRILSAVAGQLQDRGITPEPGRPGAPLPTTGGRRRSRAAALVGAAAAISAAGGIEAASVGLFAAEAGIAGQLALFMADFNQFGQDFLEGRSPDPDAVL